MSKHILIPCQYFYPEQFRINDIAFEFVKRGYRVTVVTGIPNYPEGKFYSGYSWFSNRKEKVNGVEVIRLPIIPRGKNKIGLILNYFSYPFVGLIWNRFTKIEADAVFMFETSPMNQLKVGVAYAKKHNIPAYAYIQDLWPENVQSVGKVNSPIIIKPIERMVEKIYKGCNHIFTTSPSFVELIQKRLPENERSKVHFWPQYAEEFYQPKEKIAHDKFRIIFTGNIGAAQGLDSLPLAAKLIKEKGFSDIEFVIVGDGRARESFEKAIVDADVADMFELLGRKLPAEIPNLLASADVAFISLKEENTIPAKLQSYMACKMPILAVASGEVVRVIREAKCGMDSVISDVNALVDNIISMRDMDMGKLLDMGQNAYEYNLINFSKKKLMDEMQEYLENPYK